MSFRMLNLNYWRASTSSSEQVPDVLHKSHVGDERKHNTLQQILNPRPTPSSSDVGIQTMNSATRAALEIVWRENWEVNRFREKPRRVVMRSYSLDPEDRVVAAVEANEGTQEEIAARFRVRVAWITRIRRQQKDLGIWSCRRSAAAVSRF
jgi:hypothetical protein